VNSTEMRNKNGWHKSFVEVIDGNHAYLSVVFSWDLGKATVRACELLSQGFSVSIGGPAARYAGVGRASHCNAVTWHNPDACSTSTGCVNDCSFCIVPKIEGDLVEKMDSEWEPKPIVYDNNITACSRRHFDRAIDRLKPIKNVDINQGISATVSPYQASRLAELDLRIVRLAWDSAGFESQFMRGWNTLRMAGFPKSRIGAYILIGFRDTPDDALYRLESVRKLGSIPFPMRYQPLDTPKRNSFVGENWTHKELVRYCRYWANLRITSKIPFQEFRG
jgi:hypothetical protein